MINVAMLTPFFTGQLGGPYNVITEIVPYLAQNNVISRVFTTSSIKKFGKMRTEFFEKRSDYFEIYRFHSLLRFKEYRISLEMLPFMIKNTENIDIIHSHAMRSYQEDVGAIFSLMKKKPMIISPHGGIAINWDYSDKIPKMISDKTAGLLKKTLNPHYIAVTKSEIPLIRKLGAKNDHIHFIPHGVNTMVFKPMDSSDLKKSLGLNDFKLILYVGRIAKGKGVDKLIHVLANLRDEMQKLKLIIIGADTGYLSNVKALIKKYKLEERVIFLGFINKKDLAKYYSLADLVVYPSRQEIFGLVLVEAMACGKPVIGSNIMGPSEIIVDGKTGYTSDFKDLKELTSKILELLINDKKRIEFGKNGLNRVKKYFTWEKAAESHFNLYRKLLT